jgi:hydrophobe/amphiphile efflux-3 (HAE3) family protein
MPHLPRILRATCWLRYIVDHPRRILLLYLLITLLFAFQLPKLRFQTGIYDLVIEDLPQTVFYREFKKTFGSEEFILVVVKARDVFQAATFRQLTELSDKFSEIRGIRRVISLPGIKKAMDVTGSVSLKRFQEVIAPVVLFQKNLLSKDHTTTVISLVLEDIKEKGDIIASLQRIIDEQHKGISLYQIGMPVVADALARYTKNDFSRLPLITLIIIALILFLFLRSVGKILVPLGSVLMGLVWTFGLMSLTAVPLSMLTMIVPVFLLAVGTAYCMYTLPAYLRATKEYPSPSEASYQCFSELKLPTFLAVLTTIIGLASLLVSHIGAIRQFALFSCFGILSMLIIILSFLPAVLALLPWPRKNSSGLAENSKSLFAGLLDRIIDINIHSQKVTLPLLACIASFGLAGILQIHVETNPIDYFRKNTAVHRHFFDISRDLAGSFPLNVEIDSREEDFFERPDHLKQIEKIQTFLSTLPGVDKTISFLDYLKLVNYASNQYKKSAYVLPDEGFEVRMLMNDFKSMLGEDMFQRFMGKNLSKLNILLRTHISSSSDFLKTQERIDSYLHDRLPKNFTSQVTGIGVVISHTSRFLTRGQVKSLFLTLILIFIIMTVLFLSFKVGFIAMLPNLFPIIVNFGLMGWLNIPLSMVTSLVASIAIGLAVDDTIHYLVNYNKLFRYDLKKREALRKTIQRVGSPIIFTSLTISLGFSVLLFSSFKPTVIFGLMMVVTMLSALVGDLILLPSLMLHMELVTIWDLLRIKLGKDPQEGIQVFNGLSRSQVHYILMAGGLKQFKAGEIIFRKGEFSDSMYAVISGDLDVVELPFREEEAEYTRNARIINRLHAGDVLGEMGMIRSCKRSATVVAATPAELLVINDRMLRRLQWLYPPTARRVFTNLMTVVCDRLERLTECYLEDSATDTLTGVIPRNFFSIMLDKEIAVANRHKIPLSLVVFQINDSGNLAGCGREETDRLFNSIGFFLKASFREVDILCRYDYRLFAVLMPHTAGAEAAAVSARVNGLLSHHTFPFQPASITIRASFGVAPYNADHPEAPENLIKRCLLALPADVSPGSERDKTADKPHKTLEDPG